MFPVVDENVLALPPRRRSTFNITSAAIIISANRTKIQHAHEARTSKRKAISRTLRTCWQLLQNSIVGAKGMLGGNTGLGNILAMPCDPLLLRGGSGLLDARCCLL